MIQAPRGTFDILPESAARSVVEEQARRKIVEEQAEKILGAAGYRRIETPTFEATELFARVHAMEKQHIGAERRGDLHHAARLHYRCHIVTLGRLI